MTHPWHDCVDDRHLSKVLPTLPLALLRQLLYPAVSPSGDRRQADLRIRRFPPWAPKKEAHMNFMEIISSSHTTCDDASSLSIEWSLDHQMTHGKIILKSRQGYISPLFYRDDREKRLLICCSFGY